MSEPTSKHLAYARSFIYEVCKAYWSNVRRSSGVSWKFRAYKQDRLHLPREDIERVREFSKSILELDSLEAAFAISVEYMKLLPREYRQLHGIYFTPNKIVSHMLNTAEEAGVNYREASILDPAAGGGAFLSPLVRRMIREDIKDDQDKITDITSRLRGFELDPFSCWLSQFFVNCELAILAPNASAPPNVVECLDSLSLPANDLDLYDFVVCNPPYGKTDSKIQRESNYSEIIHGCSNIYQLFFVLCMKSANPGGIVQLITPTSYIGGRYFKNLRVFLTESAKPLRFDFFSNRKNVFSNVLQELVVSLFAKSNKGTRAPFNEIQLIGRSELRRVSSGNAIFLSSGKWAFPKKMKSISLDRIFKHPAATLDMLGVEIRTGNIVPHRCKRNLSSHKPNNKSFPIVWSDAIQQGEFLPEISYESRRVKWFSPNPGDAASETTLSCIVVKRVTSKEQPRRIHSALIPDSFIKQQGGIVAENHVHIIKLNEKCKFSLKTLQKLFGTIIFDNLFRSISGTTTVSATELRSLPYPSMDSMIKFERATRNTKVETTIEAEAQAAYRDM